MIDPSHALKESNYFEHPFPHWIENFFDRDELNILNDNFPSSRSMAEHLMNRSYALAEAIKSQDEATALK